MQAEATQTEITKETCYVPATHAGKGRRTAVAPGETAARYPPYGRITPAATAATPAVPTGTHETRAGRGRRPAVAPGEPAARYLHYGRITLDASDETLAFENGTHETGLVCLNGAAEISTGGETFTLGRYDALYVPRDSRIEVRPTGEAGCDLAELSAPVEGTYPLQFVSFAEGRGNPTLDRKR